MVILFIAEPCNTGDVLMDACISKIQFLMSPGPLRSLEVDDILVRFHIIDHLKIFFFYIIHKNLLLTGHNLGEGCEQQGPAMITNGIIAHLRRLGKTEQIILHYKHQCFSCKTVRSFHVFSSIFHLFLYVLMPR